MNRPTERGTITEEIRMLFQWTGHNQLYFEFTTHSRRTWASPLDRTLNACHSFQFSEPLGGRHCCTPLYVKDTRAPKEHIAVEKHGGWMGEASCSDGCIPRSHE